MPCNLWKHRNDMVYQKWPSPDIRRLPQDIVHEVEEWVEAGFLTLSVPLGAWSQTNNAM